MYQIVLLVLRMILNSIRLFILISVSLCGIALIVETIYLSVPYIKAYPILTYKATVPTNVILCSGNSLQWSE